MLPNTENVLGQGFKATKKERRKKRSIKNVDEQAIDVNFRLLSYVDH